MRLKEIRQEKGLTQKQVADYIGCYPCAYSRYETGEREPSIYILKQLSRFLGVSIDCIVGNDLSPDTNHFDAYETALIRAAREADDRAREDALSMLQMHKKTDE